MFYFKDALLACAVYAGEDNASITSVSVAVIDVLIQDAINNIICSMDVDIFYLMT